MTDQVQSVTSVPLLDLQAQYAPIRDEILAAVVRVCDSQRFILGLEVETFEREVAAHIGVRHAIGVSSGTDALLVAMMALGIGPGDEVVTSTYSFFATAGCVARLGATPVLVDIDPVTFNIDPAGVRAAITPRTKAIIPVHLFGQSADLGPIRDAARAAGNIPVIEDACQAIGATYAGVPVGTIGELGCFSFFPSKNLGAFGDAGLVTTNDDTLAATVRRLRTHGGDKQYHHTQIGGNFRLDALHAAVLRVKLPHLQGWSDARRRNAVRYTTLFAETKPAQVTAPREIQSNHHIYNQYVIRVPNRDAVRAHLQDRAIGTAVYYPVPFHEQVCFRYLGYQHGQFPHAERAAAETLALPIYGELTEAQQRYVVATIGEAVGRT